MSDDQIRSSRQADVHDLGYMIDQLTRFLSDNHVMFAKNLKMAISEGSDKGTACQVLEFKAELISAQTSTPLSSAPFDSMDQNLTSLDWSGLFSEAGADFEQNRTESCPGGTSSFQDGHQSVHVGSLMNWFGGDVESWAPSSPASRVLHSLEDADEQREPGLDIASVPRAVGNRVAAPAHHSSPLRPGSSTETPSCAVYDQGGQASGLGRKPSPPIVDGGAPVQESTAPPISGPDSTTSAVPRRLRIQLTSTARAILRADWADYLRVELPRWARGALWKPLMGADGNVAAGEQSRYRDLQVAYSTVCLLHTRLGDDAIRGRIALVELHIQYSQAVRTWKSDKNDHGIGRGHATCIIDHILKNAHHDWSHLDSEVRRALRTQFHHRKRYGKRWATLADGLGKGIFLLCSHKLEKLVGNTAVNHDMLSWLMRETQHNGGQQMRLLAAVDAIAEKVYSGQVCSVGEVDEFLERVGRFGGTNGALDVPSQR